MLSTKISALSNLFSSSVLCLSHSCTGIEFVLFAFALLFFKPKFGVKLRCYVPRLCSESQGSAINFCGKFLSFLRPLINASCFPMKSAVGSFSMFVSSARTPSSECKTSSNSLINQKIHVFRCSCVPTQIVPSSIGPISFYRFYAAYRQPGAGCRAKMQGCLFDCSHGFLQLWFSALNQPVVHRFALVGNVTER